MAAGHGYRAVGIDRDPAMVDAARRHAHGMSDCRFETRELTEVGALQADVVSAASLLCVLPDAVVGLRQLSPPLGPAAPSW